MPDINIGSKLDAKGFKQAETSLDKLEKNAKGLAKTFGATFSATAVLAYAKKSIKAAAEDQSAQASLGQTLKNLGFENKAVADSVNGFITQLERQTGILDDELRPAMDRLLRATGSVTKSQELMGLALDISAGTGKDLGQVTQSLQKAYLGQTQALGRLGVGLSKAELASSNFEEITGRLTVLFAGQAKRQADSFKGSMDKLAVASNNVSEIIGTGLIDSLKILSEDTSIDNLSKSMEDLATYTADVVRGLALVIAEFKKIPGLDLLIPQLKYAILPKPFLDILDIIRKIGASSADSVSNNGLAHLAELQANAAEALLKSNKKLTAEQLKQLKAKQLQLAIDKANLALGKGENIFDMEKIQLAAAEKNAAQQLAKVTSQAQLLQITNDLARLQVKQSILALEEAIASKDVASITAATNKLNADLKVLGALTGQQVKLTEIKGILDGILPKDLINLKNLDDAIAKLKVIGGGSGGSTTTTTAPTADFIKPLTPVDVLGASLDSILEYAEAAAARARAAAEALDAQTAAEEAAFAASPLGKVLIQPSSGGGGTVINVKVEAGVGDPNAIAEAVSNVLQNAIDRGTLRNLATL
jgi:hypothetical protein